MNHYYIGIDPDITASGVAIVSRADKLLTFADTLSFPALLWLLNEKAHDEDVRWHVVVEASWTLTKNWHIPQVCSKAKAAAMGRSVGLNHATGMLISEMAKSYGLHVIEQTPLRKCWKGRDGKITHEEMAQFIPSLPTRTNQEVRDAALLAWVAAGLPIRVRV